MKTLEQYEALTTPQLAKELGVTLRAPTDRAGCVGDKRPRSYFLQLAAQEIAMLEAIENI